MNITKHKIKVKSIRFDNNNFIIESENDETFVSKIIKGSINFKIFNENDQEVNLSNLEIGELIQVFGISSLKPDEKKDIDKLLKLLGGTNFSDKNNNFKKSEQKNSIIIKKIIIKNKYIFNSESSEECDLYN
jgi:hypothetical protein